ncbi:60 kDa lysophospholipase-like isoform X2 [Daphnia pulicaria]|uniref:60 kDa lysophospholipase-like isoform X2 n=1 Tax=Daphnia pulicaria TaxID=35523 RepID=UPI001EEA6EC1|nr:60 kDa lysophospholipase-like isoform X2 [Daphnia pulicaria]
MDQLKDVLFPSLICSAVKTEDLSKLESLEKYGANLSASDSDGRTPLHVAAGEGRLSAWPVVEFLLGRGASDSVHSRDRIENTPLMSDVSGDHQEVISVLVQYGAQCSLDEWTSHDWRKAVQFRR